MRKHGDNDKEVTHMISLIIGGKGSGKTKQMIEMINNSIKTTDGNIVCIEKSMKLTYDLDHKCRLIDVDEYHIQGYDMLYGFVAGILAGNYDIKELYIDGVLKIGGYDMEGLGTLLDELNVLAGEDVKLVVTVSADDDKLPQSVKKYK